MAKRQLPSSETLRQLLRYDPDTGKLYWLPRGREWFTSDRQFKTWNTRYSGMPAFTAINSGGYHHGQVLETSIAAHQAVWAIHRGVPDRFIDHINGDRLDNRIENLRLVTASQNSTNQKISSKNTSGFKGVHWVTEKRKWKATIWFNREFRHLGYFDDIENAARAYRLAAAKYHGEYARDD